MRCLLFPTLEFTSVRARRPTCGRAAYSPLSGVMHASFLQLLLLVAAPLASFVPFGALVAYWWSYVGIWRRRRKSFSCLANGAAPVRWPASARFSSFGRVSTFYAPAQSGFPGLYGQLCWLQFSAFARSEQYSPWQPSPIVAAQETFWACLPPSMDEKEKARHGVGGHEPGLPRMVHSPASRSLELNARRLFPRLGYSAMQEA
jgi:hypothetical protein